MNAFYFHSTFNNNSKHVQTVRGTTRSDIDNSKQLKRRVLTDPEGYSPLTQKRTKYKSTPANTITSSFSCTL